MPAVMAYQWCETSVGGTLVPPTLRGSECVLKKKVPDRKYLQYRILNADLLLGFKKLFHRIRYTDENKKE